MVTLLAHTPKIEKFHPKTARSIDTHLRLLFRSRFSSSFYNPGSISRSHLVRHSKPATTMFLTSNPRPPPHSPSCVAKISSNHRGEPRSPQRSTTRDRWTHVHRIRRTVEKAGPSLSGRLAKHTEIIRGTNRYRWLLDPEGRLSSREILLQKLEFSNRGSMGEGNVWQSNSRKRRAEELQWLARMQFRACRKVTRIIFWNITSNPWVTSFSR